MTVFRSRLRADATAYPEHAARIGALAREMPGYVAHKVFVAEDGERVTLVRFADRASHEAWARHPDHRVAQRAGPTSTTRSTRSRSGRSTVPAVGADRLSAAARVRAVPVVRYRERMRRSLLLT